MIHSSRLHIDCKQGDYWAEAWPGNFKLTLHEDWRKASVGRSERVQTIVHESAHIAGVSIPREKRFYGETFSFLWARARPDLTVRNADAYGYLAIYLHNSYPTCY